MKHALTIAGSDCSGGAGLQADLKTFSALGVYGMTVVTAITAQNTVGVRDIQEVAPAMVAAQLDSIMEDIPVHAIKIGMVYSGEIIAVIASRLKTLPAIPIVLDPVMMSTTRNALLRPDACQPLIQHLAGFCTLVTPNLAEAAAMTGRPVGTPEDMKRAAQALVQLGFANVLVKGGHLSKRADDLLFDGGQYTWMENPRLETGETHGTGCTYSAAIAAGLARGLDLVDAVKSAKQYITAAIGQTIRIGQGCRPVHHMHPFYSSTGIKEAISCPKTKK